MRPHGDEQGKGVIAFSHCSCARSDGGYSFVYRSLREASPPSSHHTLTITHRPSSDAWFGMSSPAGDAAQTPSRPCAPNVLRIVTSASQLRSTVPILDVMGAYAVVNKDLGAYHPPTPLTTASLTEEASQARPPFRNISLHTTRYRAQHACQQLDLRMDGR